MFIANVRSRSRNESKGCKEKENDREGEKKNQFKKVKEGVPIMVQRKQWIRNHEVAGSIPGLAQWVRIQCCYELWCRLQTWLGSGVAVAVV